MNRHQKYALKYIGSLILGTKPPKPPSIFPRSKTAFKQFMPKSDSGCNLPKLPRGGKVGVKTGLKKLLK